MRLNILNLIFLLLRLTNINSENESGFQEGNILLLLAKKKNQNLCTYKNKDKIMFDPYTKKK